jgi:sensor histidine kinase regulating citrate/malate metabolism
MNIARVVAEIPVIYQNIGREGGVHVIQTLAERVRKSTGASYIVVIGVDGIRYSHPVPEELGELFVGGDEMHALKGESYISKAVSSLGPSMSLLTSLDTGT